MLSKKKSPYLTQFFIAVFFTFFALFQFYYKHNFEKKSDYLLKASNINTYNLLIFSSIKNSYYKNEFSKKELNQIIHEFTTIDKSNIDVKNASLYSYNPLISFYFPYIQNIFLHTVKEYNNVNNDLSFQKDFDIFNLTAFEFAKIQAKNLNNVEHNKKILQNLSLLNLANSEDLYTKTNFKNFTSWSSFLQTPELFSLFIQLNNNSEKSLKQFLSLSDDEAQQWWNKNYSSSFGNKIPQALNYLKNPSNDWENENLQFWLKKNKN